MPNSVGRPPRTSRAEIVAAALRVIDEAGVSGLTMRRLAREIGTTPMALYHHVRDKEGLLLLLLDDYAATLPRPALPRDPRERLIAVADALHEALLGRPWIAEVLRADDLFSVRALWFPEQIIDAAIEAGLSDEAAVATYRIVWHYTLGEIGARAAAARRRGEGGPTFRDQVFADLDPASYPRLSAVAPAWSELTARDTYREGIRALADGLLP